MNSMDPAVPINTEDLLDAFDWVSAGSILGSAAYVSRETGRIFWVGDGVEEPDDYPEDIEDGSLYLAVPSKQVLGLGKPLALRFAQEYLPSEVGEVHAIFSRRGAYGRFKNFLEGRGRLEDWYKFEASQVEAALAEWASENGFELRRRSERDGP